MKYTLINSIYPEKVVKSFKFENNELSKESIANIVRATYEVKETSFYGLSNTLEQLQDNQVLVLGVAPDDEGEITTKKLYNLGSAGIPRSKEFFKWHEDCAILFDIDDIEDKTVDEVLNELYKLDPRLEDAAKIIRYSSSSYLYEDENFKKEINGLKGLHIFVHAKVTPDLIEEYIESLKAKAWSINKGHFMVSSSGSLLERFVFDASVFSPERLVFEANSKLEGLYQKSRTHGVVSGVQFEVTPIKLTKQEESLAWTNKEKAKKEAAKEALPVRRKHYEALGMRAKEINDNRSARLYQKKSKTLKAFDISNKMTMSPFDILIDEAGDKHFAGDLYFDQNDWGLLETPLVDRPGQKRVNIISRGNLELKERAKIFDIPRRTFIEIELPPAIFYQRWGIEYKREYDINFVDTESLEIISYPEIEEHWDLFVELIAKHAEPFLNYNGEALQIRNERVMSLNNAVDLMWSAIKREFDFTIWGYRETKKGLIAVSIDKDLQNSLRQVFINSIKPISTLIFEQRYGIDKFKVAIEGSKAIAMKQAFIPEEPQCGLNDQQVAEIIDWYKLNKFPEIDSFLADAQSRLWGYQNRYFKNSLKTFEAVSNFGKDALIIEPLMKLGIATTFSPNDMLGMTGKNNKLGAGDPKALSEPIIIFNEVADLKGRKSHDFMEALKEFNTGLRCNAKYAREIIVRGKMALLTSKITMDSIDTMHVETLNRITILDNGTNTRLDEDSILQKYTVSELNAAITLYMYRVWMQHYLLFKNNKADELLNSIYYSWDPISERLSVDRAPMNEILKAVSYAMNDVISQMQIANSNGGSFTNFRLHSDWFVFDNGKLYITSKKSLGKMFYENMDLSAGTFDDIVKNLELIADKPKTQFSAYIDAYDNGVKIARIKAAKYRIDLAIPKMVVHHSTLEDLLDELVADPTKFKNNPMGYIESYLKF